MRQTVGQQAEGPFTPWGVAGSRGLDTWFELSAEHPMADGSYGGEPGRMYVHSSSVEHYLATLEGEEAYEGQDGYYYAWLRYVLRSLRAQDEG